MEVVRLYVGGRLENYNYLGVCTKTKEAFAVDPLNAPMIVKALEASQLTLSHIYITHEHGDHVGGVPELMKATNAKLIAPLSLKGHAVLNPVEQWLTGGETLSFGDNTSIKVLQIPGHTLSHLGFYIEHSYGKELDQPLFFCGDTIFHSGVGNCYNGGDPVVLYQTLQSLLDWLPNNTKIFPAHDNIMTNLKFSLSREPSNIEAARMLEQAEALTPETRMGTTIGEEKTYNPFLRLTSPDLLIQLKKDMPDVDTSDPQQVFVALRSLRNDW